MCRLTVLTNLNKHVADRAVCSSHSRPYALSKNCEKRLFVLSCRSVCPSHGTNRLHTDRFSRNFFFRKSVDKLQVSLKSDINNVYCIVHEDPSNLIITSRSVLLKLRNVSDRSCRRDQNTHFIFNKFFL